ncbi:DUF1640 domain-containing protein [Candidatus Trichorickettsia mobilis]|uniref:DUF1640 domain-containing protein n=1 Tax=Candidatus Trichorickettsia mobilis TaxID=1346319 RepID=A0ABZ0UQD2_9RICK|nr:coiled-coil domain-containing protein [Candidatus Trichorickettsia mobilis]WPY00257.1 DUF1640 domain-containing protein [Candidatus Trichorickettsia mobilis]
MGITNAHSLVNKLITIGLTNNQVELVTEIVDQFVTKNEFNDISKILATKTDLAELKTEFKSDIFELRTEFKSDIADLRAEFKSDIANLKTELKGDIATIKIDMLKWLLPFLLTIIGLVMSVFIKLIV